MYNKLLLTYIRTIIAMVLWKSAPKDTATARPVGSLSAPMLDDVKNSVAMVSSDRQYYNNNVRSFALRKKFVVFYLHFAVCSFFLDRIPRRLKSGESIIVDRHCKT